MFNVAIVSKPPAAAQANKLAIIEPGFQFIMRIIKRLLLSLGFTLLVPRKALPYSASIAGKCAESVEVTLSEFNINHPGHSKHPPSRGGRINEENSLLGRLGFFASLSSSF